MNAKKWHEYTTKGESAPSLVGPWVRAIESTELVARLQQAESEASQRPQPAPDEKPDRHESLATLLRAIESTEFAARLQQAESDAGQRPQPAPDEEPDRHETLAILLRAIGAGAAKTCERRRRASHSPIYPCRPSYRRATPPFLPRRSPWAARSGSGESSARCPPRPRRRQHHPPLSSAGRC